jgi:hypothetical protein
MPVEWTSPSPTLREGEDSGAYWPVTVTSSRYTSLP